MSQESCVDVLIIGAGPAGLMCGNALAMAGVSVRIIDRSYRAEKVSVGQADGIQPRTIEVLQSYGLSERLLREGQQLHMCCTERGPNVTAPTARFPFVLTLHQGAIEDIFLDSMNVHGLQVDRLTAPSAIELSENAGELNDPSSYPVKVTLEHLDATGTTIESSVRAKFVIGTDGARSWVRKTFNISMEGEQTDYIWAVVDMVPDTNFPDIHNKTVIHSINGSCMVIPREGDKVRLYIQLSDRDVVDPSTCRIDKSRMTPEKILEIARKIFHPFEMRTPPEFDWWTIYMIGQRVASTYSIKERVFIAGDACHTHSPKAGQGMNAAMNDTHNLAWKITQVLRGWAKPSLLKTYESERRRFAVDLINFDKEFAAVFSGKPRTLENQDGLTHGQFLRIFRAASGFTTGIGVRYFSSALVDPKYQKCASNLTIGQRMLPQVFLRAADARPVDIQDVLPADVRFKVLVFAGHLTEAQVGELNLIAEQLSDPSSFLLKYSADGKFSTMFDIITIIAGKKEDMSYLALPVLFRSHWSKVLLDDVDLTRSKGGHAYETFGIDPKEVIFVIVRPDGFVGMVAPSTALDDVEQYFSSFLVPANPAVSQPHPSRESS
ncbi:FAD binding domain-containing protein [Phlebopus sp. FC_14]|nr:FAD binding domain-containing protein [Phlebopus sp. FC_14]